MKKRLIPVALSTVFALCVGVASAQEEKAAPSATPSPAGTPAPAPTPAATATPSTEATVTPVPSATPEVSPSPANSAGATASPSASPAPAAQASPSPASDMLPEPSELGANAHPDDTLPSGEVPAGDLPNPDSLMPANLGEETAPPPPKVAENKFEKERSLQVRYQEVKLLALKEPAIRDMYAKAEAATTDEGKRQALREYYRLLFAKMVTIDPSLESKCDTMRDAYLRRLGQYRVEPTIPLHPPPTPEPIALAAPSATPKEKKKSQPN